MEMRLQIYPHAISLSHIKIEFCFEAMFLADRPELTVDYFVKKFRHIWHRFVPDFFAKKIAPIISSRPQPILCQCYPLL